MTSFKKRLLLSLSAAALAMPMAGGSAQAIEVVVLEQINDASQATVLEFDDLWGESLAATAATIGNSAAFNVEGQGDIASLALLQVNEGDSGEIGNQFAGIELDDIDLTGGAAEGVALTAAAIGNTLSGSGEGVIGDFDITQINAHEGEGQFAEGQYADIFLEDVALSGLESSLSAAAIGNSVSLGAGAIGVADDFDDAFQLNAGAQYAHIDVYDMVIEAAETGAFFDATSAALGNSLTLDAGEGDLFVDTLTQVNLGDEVVDDIIDSDYFGQYAAVHLYGINNVETPDTPVGVDAPGFETFDSTLVAAAIGNSASLSAEETILLDEIEQYNYTFQIADIDVDDVFGVGDLDATAVAIGNSLSITAGDSIAFDEAEGGIFQLNDWDQTPEIDIQLANINGNVDLTAAAIGNSLTMTTTEGDIDFGEVNGVGQYNSYDQYAHVDLDDVYGIEDLSATVVAIGNSASFTSGGNFSFGTDALISQINEDEQGTKLNLTELNGAGAVEITVASIGNSLSIDAEGELSGVGELEQLNLAPQGATSNLDGTLGSFASVEATTVAIGNSLSLSVGSFEGTGALEISQTNLAPQTVFARFDDAGLGGISETTAAIGNSTSVTIK